MAESPSRFVMMLAVASAMAAPGCGDASGRDWGEAAPLLDEPGFSASEVDLAMDADGNAIAVWDQRPDTGYAHSDYTVWTRRLTRGGGWGPATKLGSAGGRRGANAPSIAMNAAGQAVAVWHEWAGDRDDQTGEGVWAARYDPETGWEDSVLVGEEGYSPSVALNNQGRAMMVWAKSYDTIWASHLEPESGWNAGTRLDRDCLPRESDVTDLNGAIVFASTIPSQAGNPRIAMNDSGHAIAVWDDNENETGEIAPCNEGLSLRASRFVPGVGWSFPAAIGAPSGFYGSLHSAVAVDQTGRGLAGSLTGQVRAYSAADGWRPVELGLAWGHVSVAMADSGQAVVVWEDTSSYPVAVRAVQFSPDRGWGELETVSAAPSPTVADDAELKSPTILDSSGVDVAINDSGECFVVWHQVELPTVRFNFSVWTNRYDPGAGWSTATVLSSDDTIDAVQPRIAMDAEGRGVAVWTESKTSGENGSRDPASLMWSVFE